MENTILMTQPKNPDKPSPEPRENYLTYSMNYTNFRAGAISGATGKQKPKPRDIPGVSCEKTEAPESEIIFMPYDPDESDSADSAERDITPAEEFPETAELPRASRSAYRRRSGIPMLYTFLTAAGLFSGNLHRGFRTWRGYFRESAVRLRRFSRAAFASAFLGSGIPDCRVRLRFFRAWKAAGVGRSAYLRAWNRSCPRRSVHD